MTAGGQWSASFARASADGMRAYDDVLVPPLFVPYANDLLDRLAVGAGDALLDVACGPGTLSSLAAARGARVTGADLSPAMLAIARSKPGDVEYVECPADALAVPAGSYDVVTCQQGLQFFPDRPAALREMRRAARPGARLGIAVWNDVAESPFFAALADAIEAVLGLEAAATYRNGPWGLRSPDELSALVSGAGFGSVTVEAVRLPVTFEGGPMHLLSSLAAASVAPLVAALDDAGRAALAERATETLAPMTDGGVVRSYATSNVVTAVAT
jgi:SAM-dependent methyltransferase